MIKGIFKAYTSADTFFVTLEQFPVSPFYSAWWHCFFYLYCFTIWIPYYTHSPLSATSAVFAIQCVTVTLISLSVPIKHVYDSLLICATFHVCSVEVAALFWILCWLV